MLGNANSWSPTILLKRLLLCSVCCTISVAQDEVSKPSDASSTTTSNEPKLLDWHQDLERANEEARRRGKRILLRASAKWCLWCRKLGAEIAQPAVQKQLADWILVDIDTDENLDDARKMNIGRIPAIRNLGPDGRVIASRDGFMTASKLLEWHLQGDCCQ